MTPDIALGDLPDKSPRLLAPHIVRARQLERTAVLAEMAASTGGVQAAPLVAGVLARRRHAALNVEEALQLQDGIAEVWEIEPRQTICNEGDEVSVSTLLLSGFMTRYIDDRAGGRQVVTLHVPGDFVDLHAYPMKRLDHSIEALSAVRVAIVPHSALNYIQRTRPEMARKLWFMTLLDGAMLRRAVFRLGRLTAIERVANLMCELYLRLRAVDRAGDSQFELPLTQLDLAAVCGLTNVHVNRVLRELREKALLTFSASNVYIHDLTGLARLGHFSSEYLYLDLDAVVRAADKWQGAGHV